MIAVGVSVTSVPAPIALAADPTEMQDRSLPEYVFQESEEIKPPTLEQMVCDPYPDWCPGALAVMFCESSNNPLAFDGYNLGIFQIARRWHEKRLRPDESLFDPEVNIRVAHEIWAEQGRGPWPYCGRHFNR